VFVCVCVCVCVRVCVCGGKRSLRIVEKYSFLCKLKIRGLLKIGGNQTTFNLFS